MGDCFRLLGVEYVHYIVFLGLACVRGRLRSGHCLALNPIGIGGMNKKIYGWI
jgi:hypothetical protein